MGVSDTNRICGWSPFTSGCTLEFLLVLASSIGNLGLKIRGGVSTCNMKEPEYVCSKRNFSKYLPSIDHPRLCTVLPISTGEIPVPGAAVKRRLITPIKGVTCSERGFTVGTGWAPCYLSPSGREILCEIGNLTSR